LSGARIKNLDAVRLGLLGGGVSLAIKNHDNANTGVILVIAQFLDQGITCQRAATGVELLQFRPTENRAVTIYDQIARAHRTVIPPLLLVAVALRPSLAWRAPTRAAWL